MKKVAEELDSYYGSSSNFDKFPAPRSESLIVPEMACRYANDKMEWSHGVSPSFNKYFKTTNDIIKEHRFFIFSCQETGQIKTCLSGLSTCGLSKKSLNTVEKCHYI